MGRLGAMIHERWGRREGLGGSFGARRHDIPGTLSRGLGRHPWSLPHPSCCLWKTWDEPSLEGCALSPAHPPNGSAQAPSYCSLLSLVKEGSSMGSEVRLQTHKSAGARQGQARGSLGVVGTVMIWEFKLIQWAPTQSPKSFAWRVHLP